MSGCLWGMGFLWEDQGLHPRQEQQAGEALEKSRLLSSLKGASLECPSSRRMEAGSHSLQGSSQKRNHRLSTKTGSVCESWFHHLLVTWS